MLVSFLIKKVIGYFEQQMYRICGDSKYYRLTPIKESDRFSPWVLILGRSHYMEVNRSYPVDKRSEVKKLVRMEFDGQRILYRIANIEGGKTLVNIWVLSTNAPQALFVFPETFLLSRAIQKEGIVQLSEPVPLFITNHNGLVFSQQQNSLIKNTADFAMSVGIAPNTKVFNISVEDKLPTLLRSLKQSNLNNVVSFYLRTKSRHSYNGLLKILLPSFILGVTYLVLSSTYLLAKNEYLQRQIADSGDSVSDIINIRAQNDQKLEQYSQVQAFLNSKEQSQLVWFVMPDLFKQATVNRFEFTQGRFVISGQTEKATSILDALNNNLYVNDLRFDNPTRSSRGQEVFVISFTVIAPTSDAINVESI